MRHFLLVTMMALSSCAMVGAAAALQADETMQAWKRASETERAALLETLLGKSGAGNVKVMRCMDETSKTPGHADLPIGEVAKVCASSKNADEPV